MIDPNEFYENDELEYGRKKKIWKKIESELFKREKSLKYFFDRKSFVLGFGAALILFFSAVGVYSIIDQLIYRNTPANMKLNSVYLSAINKIETTIADKNINTGSVKLDEFINVKKEELKQIDEAIISFEQEYSKHDFSKIKQERLRQLYKLKLEVLEKIIEMEEYQL